jgi:phospholipid/cholesterol/gamma-HCH transport system substrate-binding protein
MKVADNRLKVIVGVFILLGLVIFVLGVFTLGSQKKTFIKSISLNVVFNDVGGLKEGGNIWYAGVKVGTIKKIRFYGSSQVLVTISVEQDAQKYIHKDATASISSDGLIGNKIIVIAAGSLKAPVIADGDRLSVKTSLSTDEIMKTFQVNNRNLVDITSDFKILASNLVDGKGTAGALLSDQQLASNFKLIVENLKNTSVATSQLAADLNAFAKTINREDGLANKMFTDTLLFAKLQASADELQKASKSASLLTENLSKASSKLNQTDNAAGLLLNDQQSADQMREIMKNLESSSTNLNENLKALQSNFLFRGYFRKKAKEEAEK